jgi:hypothetical protein
LNIRTHSTANDKNVDEFRRNAFKFGYCSKLSIKHEPLPTHFARSLLKNYMLVILNPIKKYIILNTVSNH